MDNFYVTLPSNTITDYNNTASRFTVHLPQKLNLMGDWECGLCQIIYPHTWENLNKDDAAIRIQLVGSKKVHKLKFPSGCYSTIQELISVLQSFLKKYSENVEMTDAAMQAFFKQYGEVIEGINNAMSLSFNNIFKRTHLEIDRTYINAVFFLDHLANMLGFKHRLYNNSVMAEYEPDLKMGFNSLYIYCNILEHQIVGDIAAPLLRIVAVEGTVLSISLRHPLDFSEK